MNKWVELVLGTLLVLAAILVFFLSESWKLAAISLLKGGLLWFILIIGFTLVILSIIELKN